MQKILITGASGLIGTHLKRMLIATGCYEVLSLSTNPRLVDGNAVFYWNVHSGEMDHAALQGVEHIIHLSGENLSKKRWTRKQKELLTESRVRAANLLFDAVKGLKLPLKTFISSSAVGYYGTKLPPDLVFDEDTKAGDDFPAALCLEWEHAAERFTELPCCRVAILRTGVVLSAKGGALPMLTKPIAWGLGTVLGSGRQYMPWIHIEDLAHMFHFILENTHLDGAYNAVAPQYITNRELVFGMAARLGRSLWLPPVPAFVLRMVMGEMSQMILHGNRVSSERIKASGFAFKYPDIDSALKDILNY